MSVSAPKLFTWISNKASPTTGEDNMKAKYLIQVYTNNPSLTASPFGFFTIAGKMTKKAAVEELAEFKALNEQRAMRVISAKDFSEECKQANRVAFNNR